MNRFCEILSDPRHGGQEQVSETMLVEFAFAFESKAKQLRHQILVFRQRNHTVADIAGWHHAEVFSKTSGTASIVGHGYDHGKIAWTVFQPSEESRQTGTSTYRNDSGLPGLQGLTYRAGLSDL
jgi:hypothetical protein